MVERWSTNPTEMAEIPEFDYSPINITGTRSIGVLVKRLVYHRNSLVGILPPGLDEDSGVILTTHTESHALCEKSESHQQ